MNALVRPVPLMLVAALAGCGGGGPDVPHGPTEQAAAAGAPCVAIALEGSFSLGPWEFQGQTVFGAIPSPATIAGIDGLFGSFVTGERRTGPTRHLSLKHVFVSDAGTFFTEDRAVCAPAGTDPARCLISDTLRVVGGSGVFADATGMLHNTARADFAAGTLSAMLRGQICAPGL